MNVDNGRNPDTAATSASALLTFAFHREGHMWVGACLELGTATDGRSFEKVERELRQLVMLHLESLEEIGERERIFEQRGIGRDGLATLIERHGLS